jgi:hypothetical protein
MIFLCEYASSGLSSQAQVTAIAVALTTSKNNTAFAHVVNLITPLSAESHRRR